MSANPKHQYYHLKVDWLTKQCKNGLTIKLLYIEGEKKAAGFIEYVPGEYCWRGVDAKGYMFIHCLWTEKKKNRNKGLGAQLIQEAEADARSAGMNGVAVVTSDGSFMTAKDIFLKNGYSIKEEAGKEQLLVKTFSGESAGVGMRPTIKADPEALKKYQGLHLIYSKQCPWVARFVDEVKPVLEEEGLKATIKELTTPEEAQNGPGLYGVFNLIHNGKMLVDRYISVTRFKNILKHLSK